MKATTQLIALLLVITSATISLSCKEDNDETPKAKTKTELLTAAPWKRAAFISNSAYDWNVNGIFDTDVLSTMFPCEKDNFDTYKANGIMETNEGPTKCDDLGPQSWTATWELTDNESKMIMNGYDPYTLVELTETTLRLTCTFEEEGVTYTQGETYSH